MTIFAFLLFLLTVMRVEDVFASNEFDEVFIRMMLYMHFLRHELALLQTAKLSR